MSYKTHKCRRCQQTKAIELFHKDRSKKSGVRGVCKECYLGFLAAERKKDPEKYRAESRRMYLKHREKRRAYHANLRCVETYGITTAQKKELWQKQGEVCAVCGETAPYNNLFWHVDHDHATNKIRGVLCCYCNVTLGQSKECIGRLQKCIAYLLYHLDTGLNKLAHNVLPSGGVLGQELAAFLT